MDEFGRPRCSCFGNRLLTKDNMTCAGSFCLMLLFHISHAVVCVSCSIVGFKHTTKHILSLLDVKPKCDTKTEFECSNGLCIDYEFTCDSQAECPGGDDELPGYCANRPCRTGYFKCNTGQCIRIEKKCDGIDSCGDNSDETTDCGIKISLVLCIRSFLYGITMLHIPQLARATDSRMQKFCVEDFFKV